ncbi:unnamed protein product [Thlaspi arvense]|uniref:MORF/ORRM1/DAG-like MORF domain-containing protein n=1 Tax=Thlaspi arvense TaxID=13288 RepID=A0AAU9T297_THLAR|nr:unnamed protein product [Thlaspi arvense]
MGISQSQIAIITRQPVLEEPGFIPPRIPRQDPRKTHDHHLPRFSGNYESEKFKDLPGVVFILPDSYIDPQNKEYGGDKYENGVITHRPPPIQHNRRPRDRFNSRFDRQGGGGGGPQNFQRNPQYGQQPPMQGGGGGYDGPQQSYEPPGQGTQAPPPPPPFQGGYNQSPTGSPPFQGGYNQGQGTQAPPPYQGGPGNYSQGPQGGYNQGGPRNYSPQGNGNSSPSSFGKIQSGALLSHNEILLSLFLKSGCLGFTYAGKTDKSKTSRERLSSHYIKNNASKNEDELLSTQGEYTNPLALFSR